MGHPFPVEELEVIDITMQMFTEPMLKANIDLLAKIWEREASQKETRRVALGIAESELQSNNKFTALLEAEGVEIQYKDGTNGQIPQFAKNDPFMQELLENEDDRIRGLAEARIGAKSTLLQTRAETLGWMARRGSLCVYLKMYAAHTTRWGGGDKCLTGDTKILTLDYRGALAYKCIVDVLVTDWVWDGEDFVEHDGVSFAGYASVINHDGISGTLDHKVYISERSTAPLAKAARTGTKIMDCREPTSWEVESARRRKQSAR